MGPPGEGPLPDACSPCLRWCRPMDSSNSFAADLNGCARFVGKETVSQVTQSQTVQDLLYESWSLELVPSIYEQRHYFFKSRAKVFPITIHSVLWLFLFRVAKIGVCQVPCNTADGLQFLTVAPRKMLFSKFSQPALMPLCFYYSCYIIFIHQRILIVCRRTVCSSVESWYPFVVREQSYGSLNATLPRIHALDSLAYPRFQIQFLALQSQVKVTRFPPLCLWLPRFCSSVWQPCWGVCVENHWDCTTLHMMLLQNAKFCPAGAFQHKHQLFLEVFRWFIMMDRYTILH